MIELHEGEETTRRFDGDNLDSYTKDSVSFEIRELFPHLCKHLYHMILLGRYIGDLKHASS